MKSIQLNSIEIHDYGGATCHLGRHDIYPTACLLLMIRNQLLKTLEMKSHDISILLETTDSATKNYIIKKDTDSDRSHYRCGIDIDSIDSLIHMLLVYARDGLADVNHCDIDCYDRDLSASSYLTFRFKDSKPPIHLS